MVLRVAGVLVPVLVLGACASGGRPVPPPSLGAPASSPSPSAPSLDAPGPAPSPTRDPADVVSAARDATQRAGSVVVTRTAQDGEDWTHEDIEVAFTVPPSARVLHVGDDIWTLNVVDGVGHLKDQSERKSTNRWTRLDDTETAARLRGLSPEGLLGVLGAATSVAAPTEETVREVPSTCHAFVLDPVEALTLAETDIGAEPGDTPSPSPTPTGAATARLCADGQERPVELVVTLGGQVTTSVFSQWGFAIEALPPPEHLVDQPGG
ncbi:hypothetical protein N801_00170 [Knoellia aerolata DSM 18566]|uniref:LppX_LprAFG lipoprotein n=1 Tax=Knoellia aerolata DSM 18566 TaxID=1385519 RepID=A0A0A0JNP0_9MICO|nr:hypothetical protein N801_00170 [Knoellia aerolata DSM 18566]